ncbi:MAG: SHOCT domain-containing protein [Pseudomonadota bacterium]
MSALTDEGEGVVADLANRHGFSVDAVTTMLHAVSAGYGTQAQFSHPEFGGMGQWSSGGMIMIGDMFNNALAGRVAVLCQEIAMVLGQRALFAPPPQSQNQGQVQGQGGLATSLFVPGGESGAWWPAELGAAGSTGAQNDLLYAYFPDSCRLAIRLGGVTTVYDTGAHRIGGFSQQQGGDQSLTFTSQLGMVRVADLPVVTPPAGPPPAAEAPVMPEAPEVAQAPVMPEPPLVAQAPLAADPPPVAAPPVDVPPVDHGPGAASASDEIVALIEKLAALHAKGVLTDAEFEAKKADLLGRL